MVELLVPAAESPPCFYTKQLFDKHVSIRPANEKMLGFFAEEGLFCLLCALQSEGVSPKRFLLLQRRRKRSPPSYFFLKFFLFFSTVN